MGYSVECEILGKPATIHVDTIEDLQELMRYGNGVKTRATARRRSATLGDARAEDEADAQQQGDELPRQGEGQSRQRVARLGQRRLRPGQGAEYQRHGSAKRVGEREASGEKDEDGSGESCGLTPHRPIAESPSPRFTAGFFVAQQRQPHKMKYTLEHYTPGA